ncbi:MAG TPA: CPBP family intramembrane glutamic endopeptidase [Symbiobacteriaceae bacterium]|jgi:membrane protease YdiL (CAAX protease family)|nr:CPBP family intramembrane glutamic endopeptidase [Symbiobacteriaceae bacterium]
MAATVQSTPRQRSRTTIGLLLLAGLILLRFPVLAGLGTALGSVPPWLDALFSTGTYLLNALLIFWERDRLEQFHIDGWTLGIYGLAPLLAFLADRNVAVYWVPLAFAAVLAVAFLLTRTRLPAARGAALKWLGAALLVGIALAVCNGLLIRWQTGRPFQFVFVPERLAMLVPAFLVQVTRAASFEEPLFRGFLWGYLRQAGWRDGWIWLLQAGLFMVGHIYYLGRYNISFFLIVPVGGLVIGWVAWRSRSIGASGIVHALGNSLGPLIGY